MTKPLPTTKYFKSPQHEYNPALVNKDVCTALGMTLPPYASYDEALGKKLIEAKVGHKFFTLAADADPDVARYQLDKNLP